MSTVKFRKVPELSPNRKFVQFVLNN